MDRCAVIGEEGAEDKVQTSVLWDISVWYQVVRRCGCLKDKDLLVRECSIQMRETLMSMLLNLVISL